MSRIESNSTVDLFFQINWSSHDTTHTDAYAGHQSSLWRDILPSPIHQNLMGKRSGDMVKATFSAVELLGRVGAHDLRTIKRDQFSGSRVHMDALKPRVGRFYPKGILADIPGIFRTNTQPFRCLGGNNGHLQIDMGHPLSGRTMDLQVTVGSIRSTLEERGGSAKDWGEIITQGVGMQARLEDQPTDFFSDQPFIRNDASADILFYVQPRLVQHMDDTAIDMVRQIYGRFINPDAKVLDLMSSWQSHFPEERPPKHVTGLGLNETELEYNPALDTFVVHDLNADATLPFEDSAFDIVVCSASVEYLTSPMGIFDEVARVLRPGGYFVTTFSNRWFEPKVIRIWTEMTEFERMGLVLEYFRNNGRFDHLGTYSIRGLPRPEHDKYYGRIAYSDPIYAAWGSKA